MSAENLKLPRIARYDCQRQSLFGFARSLAVASDEAQRVVARGIGARSARKLADEKTEGSDLRSQYAGRFGVGMFSGQ